MKLIIDIPDEAYNRLLTEQHLPNRLDIEYFIVHGIPLDRLRAEIEQMIAESKKAIRPFDGMEVVIYTKGFEDGIGSAIDVIDNYRAESEDKE